MVIMTYNEIPKKRGKEENDDRMAKISHMGG
jgi:hypothetical protein